MLTQGDTVYDVIDRRDHATWRAVLQLHRKYHGGGRHLIHRAPGIPAVAGRPSGSINSDESPGMRLISENIDGGTERSFYCRMFVARTCRRSSLTGANNYKVKYNYTLSFI